VHTNRPLFEQRALRRAGLLVACLAFAFLVTTPVGASRLEPARQRLATLEKEIKRQESAIADQHRRLDALAEDLGQIQAALEVTQANLTSTRQQLADTMTRYRRLQEQLSVVARTAFEQGMIAPIEVLLGATSSGDLMDRLQFLDSTQQANTTVANEAANEAARLTFTRHDLQALSSKQAEQKAHLQSQQDAMLAGLLGQQQLLAKLNAQRKKAAKVVRLLSLQGEPGITGAGIPFGRWSALFLARIGAPLCQQNLIVVVTWEVAEGTAAAYNPLATTSYLPGSTIFNEAGVRNYPSLGAGLRATVLTLRTGAATHGYGAILRRLVHCASAETTAAAINASDWCRGCVGGLYVLDILPLVEANYARFAGM
jgi:peptidoglycan hydrolase CwlO-like protein